MSGKTPSAAIGAIGWVSVLATVLVLWAAGCGGGGGGGPTAPGPTAAAITVVATPPSWVAGPCPPAHCGSLMGELEVTGTLTVSESAGIGADVVAIDIQLLDATGAVLGTPSYDAAAVATFAGTTRIAGRGSLTIPGVGVHFPPAGRPASLRFTVRARDDRGNLVTAAAINVVVT